MHENCRGLAPSPFCWCARVCFAVLLPVLTFAPSASAQTGRTQPLITQPIIEGNLVALSGNTRPEAREPVDDRGIVSDGMPLEHMTLQLRRSADRERALVSLIDQLHDRKSPNYQHWLSASEIGAQFGLAPSDVQAITGWLQQHGFTVNTVYPNGMVIDFSGTAAQVRTAFRTEIHNLSVDGVAHIANMTDPQIPSALAPAIAGIVGLNDFRPQALFNSAGGGHDMTPADLATIYNFTPAFSAGITGRGQTIYLVEHSDMYAATDWSTFRSAFGIPLSSYSGASLSTQHPAPPSGSNNCSDPGATGGTHGADFEATLDAEYASAAAPGAAIVLATCANGPSINGVLVAITNLVNGSNRPTIISVSYGGCEAVLGASVNFAFSSIYQTAVAGGTSIYVAGGDNSAMECNIVGVATTGIGVNGYASTPYDVAVGGTDFADTFLAKFSTPTTIHKYWGPNNASNHGSALGYIPEIPWNITCGSQLLALYHGYSTTYGSSGFCNSGSTDAVLGAVGGGGGPSGCATGSPSVSNVVSGTCAGYPRPAWQSGLLGMPNNTVRNLPDVSMFAAGSPWDHDYVTCFSDPTNGGVPCTTAPTGWKYGGAGTSFAAPIWAGVQALINQHKGGSQGLPNYRLYQLATQQYGGGSCYQVSGPGGCLFNDVADFVAQINWGDPPCGRGNIHFPCWSILRVSGDNDIPCKANKNGNYYNCYAPSGTYGVLSTSNTVYAPAYQATRGWDFATGIGTVNVYNLVTNW